MSQPSALIDNLAVYGEKLSDASIKPELRHRITKELLADTNLMQDPRRFKYVQIMLPHYIKLLKDEETDYLADSETHLLRNSVLELIKIIPVNEYSSEVEAITNCLLHVMKTDNEENASLALKIYYDILRFLKADIESSVKPFIELVFNMYDNFQEIVSFTFDGVDSSNKINGSNNQKLQQLNSVLSSDSTLSNTTDTSSDIAISKQNDNSNDNIIVYQKGMYSFKVLMDTTQIILYIFQSHVNIAQDIIDKFMEHILKCLIIQPNIIKEKLEIAEKTGNYYIGISLEIKNKTSYEDFISFKVSTTRFVAQILQKFISQLRPYMQQVADSVIITMQLCPPYAASVKRDLLLTIRHICYTEFRSAFVPHLDKLLDESVLVGGGVTTLESLRPFAHTVLVDLIHHVRGELSIEHFVKAVNLYSGILNDSHFSTTVQTICARLLLNIVDYLSFTKNKLEGRALIISILKVFVAKLGFLQNCFKAVVYYRNIRKEHSEKYKNDPKAEEISKREDADLLIVLDGEQPIKAYNLMFDNSLDPIHDIRTLLKHLVYGVRIIVNGLKNFNPSTEKDSDLLDSSLVSGFNREDVDTFISFLQNATLCCEYYNLEKYDIDGKFIHEETQDTIVSEDEQEVVKTIGTVFNMLETRFFQDVIINQIDFLVNRTIYNPLILTLPHSFLSGHLHENFFEILLLYLIKNIEKLGEEDHALGSVFLRLFKLLFSATTMFPAEHEPILVPHFGTIIMTSLRLASSSENPLNYFHLLRSLFRSIVGGTFESLYKEVVPLLQVILEELNGLIETAHSPAHKELFAELCLNVPIRVNYSLPLLTYLIKPLVLALQAGPELVNQALRLLELWIDNLTLEFLDPILKPYYNDLMTNLRLHLKPQPYNENFSHTAVRILGKLGGHNRSFSEEPIKIDFKEITRTGIKIDIHMITSVETDNSTDMKKDIDNKLGLDNRHSKKTKTSNSKQDSSKLRGGPLNLDYALDLAYRLLKSPDSTIQQKEESFQFIKYCIPLLLNTSTSGYNVEEINSVLKDFYKFQLLKLKERQRVILEEIREKLKQDSNRRRKLEEEKANNNDTEEKDNAVEEVIVEEEIANNEGTEEADKDKEAKNYIDEVNEVVINKEDIAELTEKDSNEELNKDSISSTPRDSSTKNDFSLKGNSNITRSLYSRLNSLETEYPFVNQSPMDSAKKVAYNKAISTLTSAIFHATFVDSIREEANSYLSLIITHFALLSVIEPIRHRQLEKLGNFAAKSAFITPAYIYKGFFTYSEGFIDAIVDLMLDDKEESKKLAENIIVKFISQITIFIGSKEMIQFVPICYILSQKFISCCYSSEWYKKSCGCEGISILVNKLDMGRPWMFNLQLDHVRALVDVLKDKSRDIGVKQLKNVDETILAIIKVCNNDDSTSKSREEEEEEEELTEDEKALHETNMLQRSLERKSSSGSLVSLLISALYDSSPAVRQAAQKSLQLLSTLMKQPISNFLLPLRNNLTSRIYSKPLRTLPFAMQIGSIDAITYCLKLSPPLLPISDELQRLVQEVLALADAEDEALLGSSAKSPHFSDSTLIASLRTGCIKLLTAISSIEEFHQQYQSIKPRIVSVFFKLLYSTSPEVVDAAYEGLETNLKFYGGRFPKDQLHNGLRPILVDLANYRQLTVTGLSVLHKLLQLLASSFKIETGNKLLDHLKEWHVAGKLSEFSKRPLDNFDGVKIIVAILNVFHMFPSMALVFMENIVYEVVALEDSMSRSVSSPFRPPLIKYLNKYPSESVKFFIDHLENEKMTLLFKDILITDDAAPLREEFVKQIGSLRSKCISIIFPDEAIEVLSIESKKELEDSDDKMNVEQKEVTEVAGESNESTETPKKDEDSANTNDKSNQLMKEIETNVEENGAKEEKPSDLLLTTKTDNTIYNPIISRTVLILDSLCKYDPSILKEQTEVVELVYKIWNILINESNTKIETETIIERAVVSGSTVIKSNYYHELLQRAIHIIYSYLQFHRDNSTWHFELMKSLSTKNFADAVDFKVHLFNIVAKTYTPEEKVHLIVDFMNNFEEFQKDGELSGLILQYLIRPMLCYNFDQENWKLIEENNLVGGIHDKIWEPIANESVEFSDFLRLEVLQLTTIFVTHIDEIDQHYRKTIIKFCWSYQKIDDSLVNHASYVLLALFISKHDTPSKIVQSVYDNILLLNESDTLTPQVKTMVRQALHYLIPVLPQRIVSDRHFPRYVDTLRKSINEKMNNAQRLTTIYYLLVTFPDMFYESRSAFVIQILGSLVKSAGQAINSETRRLFVDVCQLLLDWEKKCRLPEENTKAGEKRKADSDIENPPAKKGVNSKHLSNSSDSNEPILDPMHQSLLVAFMMRISIQPDYMQNKHLCTRLIGLIDTAIELWPEVDISLSYIEKLESEPIDTQLPFILNTAEMLKVISSRKVDKWIISHLPAIHKILEKWYKLDNVNISLTLKPVSERLLSILSDINSENINKDSEDNNDEKSFATDLDSKSGLQTSEETKVYVELVSHRKFVENKVNSMFKDVSSTLMGQISPSLTSAQIYCGLVFLESLSKFPSLLDSSLYVPECYKLFGKLIKDHLQDSTASKSSDNVDSPDALLVMVLNILKTEVGKMGDIRRNFFQTLAQLIESTRSIELLKCIFEVCKNWILNQQESFPSIKEKLSIMLKLLTTFEILGDKILSNNFYNFVAEIYEDPSFARSELTVRLEPAFMIGYCNSDTKISSRFSTILNNSISLSCIVRLNYIFGVQNWEHIAEYFWLNQATDILLGSVHDAPKLSKVGLGSVQISPLDTSGLVNYLEDVGATKADIEKIIGSYSEKAPEHPERRSSRRHSKASIRSKAVEDKSEVLDAITDRNTVILKEIWKSIEIDLDTDKESLSVIEDYHTELKPINRWPISSIIPFIRNFLFIDNKFTLSIWRQLFPISWNVVGSREQHEIQKAIIPLLAKDFHIRQREAKPNVIQALLLSISKCSPRMALPPQLVKYLGQSYNAWYIAWTILEESITDNNLQTSAVVSVKEDEKIRGSTTDALCDLLWELNEEDYFFGLWRRRCLFTETNAALSYEQAGLWPHAQKLYESAQSKARTGVLSFSEAEYCVWEDHWIRSAERLQEWDILTDLAKHEGNTDLLMECAWRLSDWSAEKESLTVAVGSLSQNAPRTKVFEAFLELLNFEDKNANQQNTAQKLQRICDEGIELLLKRWQELPTTAVNAHIPILHSFQQFVELMETVTIYKSLGETGPQNLEEKHDVLKGILRTWRERLPNVWDDINIWSDMVHWRQHVFQIINRAYLPLITALNSHPGRENQSSLAFRGYHETAWIINRFAQVARRHLLVDVCNDSLSKIYTLPNIEIHEAFFKLREQAKSYFVNVSDYATGLDVINNTNLLYFTQAQKSEFFALKGIFFSKLNLHTDATKSFETALAIDTNLDKAWSAWGHYNDRMFKENPTNLSYAEQAMTCYLQTVNIINDARCRKFISRILYLLTIEDSEDIIGKAFDTINVENSLWYWITYVPQMLLGLSEQEETRVLKVLIEIARKYPQAMHFQLKTAMDDIRLIKKTQSTRNTSSGELESTNRASLHIEELMSVVKTTFPLVALSMETILDQINQRLKPSPEEDIYRLIITLLNDSVNMYIQKLGYGGAKGDYTLSVASTTSLTKFAESMLPNHIKFKNQFEEDFIHSKPNMAELVERLRSWRNRIDDFIDRRPSKQPLESFSRWLFDFEYQKFDDIEVPGQYSKLSDNNRFFVRIDRFEPEVELIKGSVSCYRRITIRGHDGSLHPFAVQSPAARNCRREEQVVQLFSLFNGILSRRKETKRRQVLFQLPTVVPLMHNIRLVQDDPVNITLQGIWEDHCKRIGIPKDVSSVFQIKKIEEFFHIISETSVKGKVEPEQATDSSKPPEGPLPTKNNPVTRLDMLNLKKEIMDSIQTRYMPDTIVSNYFIRVLQNYEDIWLVRKQFARSFAACTFITYILSIGQRYPYRYHIARNSGRVQVSELIPSYHTESQLFANQDGVSFRFTPNIQQFITPIGVDGIFAPTVQAIGRALTETEYEMEDYLSLFVRNEVVMRQIFSNKPALTKDKVQEIVIQNSELLLKRSLGLACATERKKMDIEGTQPSKLEAVDQTILDLISQAVNPIKLAQMDAVFLPLL